MAQIDFTNGTAWSMTTTKSYDCLSRLLGVSTFNQQLSTINVFSYSYNSANQRVRSTLADASHWEYRYDSLGQVRTGKRYWQDATPVAGQQFEYTHDTIGNRTGTATGGDATGGGLRGAAYTPNRLNQYTQRDVPGHVDVLGIANPTAPVKVNGVDAYRKGEYFHLAQPVDNSGAPQYTNITVVSTYGTTETNSGHVYVPETPEAFSYDADGNLTQDGRWNYTWDAENRLVAMAANTAVGPQISLRFEYDWQGRRIRKQVWPNTTWSGSPTNDLRFVYDGWNLIATLNSQLSTLNSFVWGLDLSGSLQGAGGVGGLLWLSEISNGQISNSHFTSYGGNGNVAALISAADGSVSARYEYGPFGELVRATYGSPLVRQSLGGGGFRFSTKYQDDETDLLYYGYRYYNAGTGRWTSRDPIGERGGANHYAFVWNDSTSHVDFLGHVTIVYGCPSWRACYKCSVAIQGGWAGYWYLALHSEKFIKCAARSVGVMNLGCTLGSVGIFDKGCMGLGDCFRLYSGPTPPELPLPPYIPF